MQVPTSQGYCNSFGLKAGACMLVKNGDDMNLKSKQKKAGSKLAKTGNVSLFIASCWPDKPTTPVNFW